jgi:DNA-binding PadR family transcriptional regulator
MAKKTLELLTETMFYVLMALRSRELCGTEIADYINQKTAGRVLIGPGTLYTILSKFMTEKLIEEVKVTGRKRTYAITPAGRAAFNDELKRLKLCVADAEREGF